MRIQLTGRASFGRQVQGVKDGQRRRVGHGVHAKCEQFCPFFFLSKMASTLNKHEIFIIIFFSEMASTLNVGT